MLRACVTDRHDIDQSAGGTAWLRDDADQIAVHPPSTAYAAPVT
jgi:hypothetical protein